MKVPAEPALAAAEAALDAVPPGGRLLTLGAAPPWRARAPAAAAHAALGAAARAAGKRLADAGDDTSRGCEPDLAGGGGAGAGSGERAAAVAALGAARVADRTIAEPRARVVVHAPAVVGRGARDGRLHHGLAVRAVAVARAVAAASVGEADAAVGEALGRAAAAAPVPRVARERWPQRALRTARHRHRSTRGWIRGLCTRRHRERRRQLDRRRVERVPARLALDGAQFGEAKGALGPVERVRLGVGELHPVRGRERREGPERGEGGQDDGRGRGGARGGLAVCVLLARAVAVTTPAASAATWAPTVPLATEAAPAHVAGGVIHAI